MGKRLFPITAAIFLVIILFKVTISTYGKTGELNDLLQRADAVVVVEIISTDYT